MVGNGPSLKITPIDRIKDEYTFTMNSIGEAMDKHDWIPTFYIATSRQAAMDKYRHNVTKVVENGETIVLACSHNRQYIGDYPNVYYSECRHDAGLLAEAPDEFWSNEPDVWISKFGSSMLPAAQWAVWMGFNPLIFIGCDLGWVPVPEGEPDPNHYHENAFTDGITPEIAEGFNRAMLAAHELTKRWCDRLGVKCYNATIGGELEIYPRIDYFEKWPEATA